MEHVLRKYLWVVNLLSLAAMAAFLAMGTGALISLFFVSSAAEDEPLRARSAKRSRSEPRFSKRSGADICRHNVFNFAKRPCSDDASFGDEEGDEEEESTGPIPPMCEGEGELIATMASTDPEWSFAMIKSGGATMPYRAGDDVEGMGKLKQVGWRLVLVDAEGGPDCLLDLYPPSGEKAKKGAKRGGTPSPKKGDDSKSRRGRGRSKLSLALQKAVDEGIEVVSATERNIDRGLVDQLIENSSDLMSQARILPYERDGAVQGFKLYGIRRNSLLGKLGLRNGDIVNSIGGMEMTSPDRALQAYTKLRNTSNLAITVTRRGRRQSLDFNIR